MKSPTSPHRAPLLVRRPGLVDSATLAVALVAGVAGTINYAVVGQVGGLAGVVVAIAGVALLRHWPWPALVLSAAAPLLGAWLGADPLVLWSMAVFVVLVASLRGSPALLAGALIGVAAYVSVVVFDHGGGNRLATMSFPVHFDRSSWLDPLAVLSFAVAVAFASIGASLRATQRFYSEVQARADDALAIREAEVERRVAEERLRIAHDLHDTLGHEIALVSMSVGAAEARLDTDLDAARADLAQAGLRIQKVLAETQRTLAVLRNPQDNTPAAGYDQITRLVDEFTGAGMEVATTIAAQPDRLDPQTGAAAYRITQEALVNARKHGIGTVRLDIGVDRGTIHIQVVNQRAQTRDDGEAGPGGYGLIGMRERAASAGGRIDVESDDALFTLRAALPIGGRTST